MGVVKSIRTARLSFGGLRGRKAGEMSVIETQERDRRDERRKDRFTKNSDG